GRGGGRGGGGGKGVGTAMSSKSSSSSIASSTTTSSSLINPFPTAYSRTIKQTESAAAKGWQPYEKKEWRDRERGDRDGTSREWKDFSGKDRYAGDRAGGAAFRKRKWDRDDDSSNSTEKREESGRRESIGQKKERKSEEKNEEKRRKESSAAGGSYDSPPADEDAMQISPYIEEIENDTMIGGEPEPKRPVFSPLPTPSEAVLVAAATASALLPPVRPSIAPTHSAHDAPHHLNHHVPGAIPPWGAAGGQGWPGAGSGGWHGPPQWGAGGPQMGYGGPAYANGTPHALSYFNLAPAPGSSLMEELVFWRGAISYSQKRAEEIQYRLDLAKEHEMQLNPHLQQQAAAAAAAAIPVPAPVPAVDAPAAPPSPAPPLPTEEKGSKPSRPNLNDRLAALTGVPIKSGGGGVAVPRTPEERSERKGPETPPPRPPSRPTESELASAKCVRTKDGRLIPIESISKYCKVHTENGATYYYNKFTRSPTWEVPAGETANSEDELEFDPLTRKSSSAMSGDVQAAGRGGGAAAAAKATAATAGGDRKSSGSRARRPQTPPEEPADPISSVEVDEKIKLQRKSEFKTRSGELLKRYVKASMFGSVDDFKKTLRKIIHGCIEKEIKMNPQFNFVYTDDVRHRMVEYTKKYVNRHKLRPMSYPEGIAD
ncbi:hypothetical protein PFISCL1PPCAC_18308, partial [Pristionchus fissidentatus]